MKNKVWTVLLAAMAAVVLVGCTQADTGNSGAAAGASSGSTSGSGTVSGGSTGTDTDTTNQSSGTGSQTVSGTVAGGDASADNGTSDILDGGAVDGVSVEDEEQNTATEAPAVLEENYSDDELNAQDEDETAGEALDEGWAGTYVSENDETLTVSIDDPSAISFAFTNSGISGKAELDGVQAVYHGDDQYVIVFDYAGSDIQVSVLSEEDYDASDSPLIGVYVRNSEA